MTWVVFFGLLAVVSAICVLALTAWDTALNRATQGKRGSDGEYIWNDTTLRALGFALSWVFCGSAFGALLTGAWQIAVRITR